MKMEAYSKLLMAIENDDLDMFIEAKGMYAVIISGMMGEQYTRHDADYNAIYSALDMFVKQFPEQQSVLQEKLLEILETGSVNTTRAFIEIVYQRLRYSPRDLGFVNDQILFELQQKIKEYGEQLSQIDDFNVQQMDEWAYQTSGRHFAK